MAGLSDKADKKIAKNFRLSGGTITIIGELSSFFDESQAGVIERAVAFLNNNKKLAIEQESTQRISQLSSK